MEQQPLYIVRGTAKNGTVTYKCPTPEWAVRKYRDLTARNLTDVEITGPGGQSLSLADLESVSNEAAVPMARAAATHV
jgi:hypothetical protein